jgi:hypothetical protein
MKHVTSTQGFDRCRLQVNRRLVYLHRLDPAGAILSGDVLDLWPKLINSETATDFFAHGGRNTYSNLNLTGIQIYDTLNNRFVGPGFVSVDLPRRNHLARWDGYIARFIGTGWSWW